MITEKAEQAKTKRIGRPVIGDQIKIAFPDDLLIEIDDARGDMTRSAWIREACRAALDRR